MCVSVEARSKLAKLLFKSMFLKDTTHLFVLFTVCVVYASILLMCTTVNKCLQSVNVLFIMLVVVDQNRGCGCHTLPKLYFKLPVPLADFLDLFIR